MKLNNGIASDSIWLTIVKVITALISIIITKILSVKFSLWEYGTYSQAMLIVSFATSLSILGLSDGTNYFYNVTDDINQKKKYMNTIFSIQMLIGMICAIIIIGISGLLTNYYNNPNLQKIYIWIIFSPMLSNFIAMYQVLFISIGKARIIAIRNLVMALIKLGIISFAAIISQDVMTIFILTFFADFGQVLYFALFFRRKCFKIHFFKIDFSNVKSILNYCIPLAIYILTNALARDMDKYFVSIVADTETFAIFSNCAKVLPFDMLTTSFATVMIPIVTRFIAQNNLEEAQKLYRDYLSIGYTTTWIIAFGVVICSREVMYLLYDDKYISGLAIFVVYIFVDMIRFANVAIILRAKGKTRLLMIYSFAMLIANLIFNTIFYNIFGIIGPALSTLVVTFIMNMGMLINGASILRCKVYQLINIKDMVLLIIQLIIIGTIAMKINSVLEQYFSLHYVVRLILTYGLYVLALGLINFRKIICLFRSINSINK